MNVSQVLTLPHLLYFHDLNPCNPHRCVDLRSKNDYIVARYRLSVVRFSLQCSIGNGIILVMGIHPYLFGKDGPSCLHHEGSLPVSTTNWVDVNIKPSVDICGRTNQLKEPSYQLTCEDNLTFLNRFPDNNFKLIVTSPPYNLGEDYETRMSIEDYVESQSMVIRECIRVLHPNGSICWQVGNYVDDGEIVPIDAILYPVFRSVGLKLNTHTWTVKSTCWSITEGCGTKFWAWLKVWMQMNVRQKNLAKRPCTVRCCSIQDEWTRNLRTDSLLSDGENVEVISGSQQTTNC